MGAVRHFELRPRNLYQLRTAIWELQYRRLLLKQLSQNDYADSIGCTEPISKRFLLFLLFNGDFRQLIALIAHCGNIGRMADQDHALALLCKITEDIHDLLLRITVKVTGRLVCKNNIGVI